MLWLLRGKWVWGWGVEWRRHDGRTKPVCEEEREREREEEAKEIKEMKTKKAKKTDARITKENKQR